MDNNTIGTLAMGALISYLIPKVTPYTDKYIRIFFSQLLNTLFFPVKGYFRKKRLNKLRKFRKDRANDSVVALLIARANAYFLLFWGVVLFYLNLIIQTKLGEIFNENFILAMILTIPVYVIELIWLTADRKANILVQHKGRLGI